jgi:hypothetical protein
VARHPWRLHRVGVRPNAPFPGFVPASRPASSGGSCWFWFIPQRSDSRVRKPAGQRGSGPQYLAPSCAYLAICERLPNLRGRARRAHFALNRLAKRAKRPPASEPAANRRSAAMSLATILAGFSPLYLRLNQLRVTRTSRSWSVIGRGGNGMAVFGDHSCATKVHPDRDALQLKGPAPLPAKT